MKTINQLKEEIKAGGITDPHTANIELYKRLYVEIKERINFICYSAMHDENISDREIAFEIFHIIDAFSFSSGQEFSRKDFAEDLKIYIFSMSGRHYEAYKEWFGEMSAGCEDLQ